MGQEAHPLRPRAHEPVLQPPGPDQVPKAVEDFPGHHPGPGLGLKEAVQFLHQPPGLPGLLRQPPQGVHPGHVHHVAVDAGGQVDADGLVGRQPLQGRTLGEGVAEARPAAGGVHVGRGQTRDPGEHVAVKELQVQVADPYQPLMAQDPETVFQGRGQLQLGHPGFQQLRHRLVGLVQDGRGPAQLLDFIGAFDHALAPHQGGEVPDGMLRQ